MKILLKESETKLKMPWKKCIGMGRAYELLRSDVMEHLSFLQKSIGFESCRFHALFHDDMDVMRLDRNSNPIYQWHHIDKVYDSMLSIGLRPFVELNSMPSCIASGEQTMFYYKMNVTVPKSFELWEDLIYNFTRHVTERYGENEVRKWHFEVWNEPNLGGFWSGSQAEYFELYRHSAKAVKRVNSDYKVGGPASSKCSWLSDFINYCVETETPVDFVSTHLYGQDEYVEYPDREGSPYAVGTFFTERIKEAKAEVAASKLPSLELHFTEWNTMMATRTRGVSWIENPDVDTHFAASHIVKHCMELDEVLDSFSYWVATDIFEESGIPDTPLSCTYGLLNIHGIPKASANAFILLNKMRGAMLDVSAVELPQYASIAATKDGDRINIIAWYYKPHELECTELPEVETVIDISELLDKAKSYRGIKISIDSGHGSMAESWLELGSPTNITCQEEEFLRACAQPNYTLVSCDNGKLALKLKAEDVIYFEIYPLQQTLAVEHDSELKDWDQKMSEKSR